MGGERGEIFGSSTEPTASVGSRESQSPPAGGAFAQVVPVPFWGVPRRGHQTRVHLSERLDGRRIIDGAKD